MASIWRVTIGASVSVNICSGFCDDGFGAYLRADYVPWRVHAGSRSGYVVWDLSFLQLSYALVALGGWG